jgi:hypothetical protein
MPSMAFFETRSENAVSASLHFSSAQALEKWRDILPRTGTSNFSRCPFVGPDCVDGRCDGNERPPALNVMLGPGSVYPPQPRATQEWLAEQRLEERNPQRRQW